jgi:hypothetical protein
MVFNDLSLAILILGKSSIHFSRGGSHGAGSVTFFLLDTSLKANFLIFSFFHLMSIQFVS